jgi:hypothetical protein
MLFPRDERVAPQEYGGGRSFSLFEIGVAFCENRKIPYPCPAILALQKRLLHLTETP